MKKEYGTLSDNHGVMVGQNSAKYSDDLYSETTGPIMVKLGHNEYLVKEIRTVT